MHIQISIEDKGSENLKRSLFPLLLTNLCIYIGDVVFNFD